MCSYPPTPPRPFSLQIFVTMILLSLLLAIIVDSFLRVKAAEETVARGAEPKGVHIELGHIVREGLGWLWAPFSKRVRVGERRIAEQLAEWAAGPRGVVRERAGLPDKPTPRPKNAPAFAQAARVHSAQASVSLSSDALCESNLTLRFPAPLLLHF